MADKKIIDLPDEGSMSVAEEDKLIFIGDPADGKLYKGQKPSSFTIPPVRFGIEDTFAAGLDRQAQIDDANSLKIFSGTEDYSGLEAELNLQNGIAAMYSQSADTLSFGNIVITSGQIELSSKSTFPIISNLALSDNSGTHASLLIRQAFSGGATSNGFGSALIWQLSTTNESTLHSSGSISSVWTDSSDLTYTANMEFWTTGNAVSHRRMVIGGDGSLKFDYYGAGLFTGTPAYALAVDASGNVIEISVGGGGGTPDLQAVTDAGNTTTNDIHLAGTGGGTLDFYVSGTAGSIDIFDSSNTALTTITAMGISRNYFSTTEAYNFPYTGTGTSHVLALSVNGVYAGSDGNIVIPAGVGSLQDVTDVGNFTTNDIQAASGTVNLLANSGDPTVEISAGSALLDITSNHIARNDGFVTDTFVFPSTGVGAVHYMPLSVNGVFAGSDGSISIPVGGGVGSTRITTVATTAALSGLSNANYDYAILHKTDDYAAGINGMYEWNASAGEYSATGGGFWKKQIPALLDDAEYHSQKRLHLWNTNATGYSSSKPPIHLFIRNDAGEGVNSAWGAMICGSAFGGAMNFVNDFSNSANRMLQLGTIDNTYTFTNYLEMHYSTGGNSAILRVPLTPASATTQSIGTSALPFATGFFGGLATGYVSKSSNYTTTTNDFAIDANAVGVGFTITLGSSFATGKIQVIRKTDSSANVVTVAGTINGIVNYLLSTQYQFIMVQYNGTNWNIISVGVSANVVDTLDATLGAGDSSAAHSVKLGTSIGTNDPTLFIQGLLISTTTISKSFYTGIYGGNVTVSIPSTEVRIGAGAGGSETILGMSMQTNRYYTFKGVFNIVRNSTIADRMSAEFCVSGYYTGSGTPTVDTLSSNVIFATGNLASPTITAVGASGGSIYLQVTAAGITTKDYQASGYCIVSIEKYA